MARYRRRPVVLEATQWQGWSEGPHDLGVQRLFTDRHGTDRHGLISTLEGWPLVSPGDWIITGSKGGKYVCRPDVFLATYELVKERSE